MNLFAELAVMEAEIAHVRLRSATAYCAPIVLLHDEPTMGSALNWAQSRLLNLHRDVAYDRAASLSM
jgi:hypothetical protein